MSLETQRKLRYIPFINMLIFFFWAKTYFNYSTNIFGFFKMLLKTFIIIIIIIVPLNYVVSYVLKASAIVVFMTGLSLRYIAFVIISGIFIKDQEQICNSNKN